jgi:hypothetical protein
VSVPDESDVERKRRDDVFIAVVAAAGHAS